MRIDLSTFIRSIRSIDPQGLALPRPWLHPSGIRECLTSIITQTTGTMLDPERTACPSVPRQDENWQKNHWRPSGETVFHTWRTRPLSHMLSGTPYNTYNPRGSIPRLFPELSRSVVLQSDGSLAPATLAPSRR